MGINCFILFHLKYFVPIISIEHLQNLTTIIVFLPDFYNCLTEPAQFLIKRIRKEVDLIIPSFANNRLTIQCRLIDNETSREVYY